MIENEFYGDDFEQLLKEKADQFSMYPSKRVWHSIYNNLHPGRRWPSVVISLVLISALMLIGYLNTGDNSITKQINSNAASEVFVKPNNDKTQKRIIAAPSVVNAQKSAIEYKIAFENAVTQEKDFYPYTVVRSNRPAYMNASPVNDAAVITTDGIVSDNNSGDIDIIQAVKTYIKSNQIFADVAVYNRKNKAVFAKPDENSANIVSSVENLNTNPAEKNTIASTDLANNDNNTEAGKLNAANDKLNTKLKLNTGTTSLNDEKAWIENFASENKTTRNKSKGRLGYRVYMVPAVNYRKLSTNSKGSATPLANSDINSSIKQRPGFGFEAGAGLSYGIAKNLRFNTGLQFNYNNYNIHADETNHPISTSVLLNNPTTGFSFVAARTTTTSNTFDAGAVKPVTLHNKTYQVSLPIGIAYKLSTKENVDWFAGVSIQPTYIFGGKANIISSDLKSYVSEPSYIRNWNLNLGFETYMNFKVGTYNLQVGPQVRYQVNSTYKKSVALIEKPYAVGIKFGLSKGF